MIQNPKIIEIVKVKLKDNSSQDINGFVSECRKLKRFKKITIEFAHEILEKNNHY